MALTPRDYASQVWSRYLPFTAGYLRSNADPTKLISSCTDTREASGDYHKSRRIRPHEAMAGWSRGQFSF